MTTPAESNQIPPEQRKSLFGALAGQIQINMESIEEWDAAMEDVWWEEYYPPPEHGQQ